MLVRELPHAIFHVDRGAIYNFIQLFKRPGKAIREYLEGRRKVFYHPASYLVVSLILNYLVVKITDLHFYDKQELLGMDETTAKAIVSYDEMQWWFLEHTYLYILIAIPLSSLFLFGLFRIAKQEFNLAESAAIVLFTIAQGVLIQTIMYALFGWTRSGAFLRGVEIVNLVMLISYATMVMYQLIRNSRRRILRFVFAATGGAGLAIVWIASAYALLEIMN
jgi:hypothetical protein